MINHNLTPAYSANTQTHSAIKPGNIYSKKTEVDGRLRLMANGILCFYFSLQPDQTPSRSGEGAILSESTELFSLIFYIRYRSLDAPSQPSLADVLVQHVLLPAAVQPLLQLSLYTILFT